MDENIPTVAAVVLNYNGKRFLEVCFNALLKTDYPRLNIYLLDNASTEDDVSYVKTHFPEIKIINCPGNNGYCAAYNLAINHCNEDYIVCINNDTEVASNWLWPLVKEVVSDSDIAALQPKMLQMQHRKRFEYSGASGGFMDQLGFPYMRGRIFTSLEEDQGQYNDSREIFWASGACLLLDRNKAVAAGGFDDTIVHHMDEIDLCWRFHLLGYLVKVVPESEIYHVGGASIKEAGYKKIYWNHRNAVYIMLKNLEFKNICIRVPIHLMLDYLAMGIYLIQGKFHGIRAILNAHLWNLMHLKTMIKSRRMVQSIRVKKDIDLEKVMYPKSVVWAFYIKGKKKWSQL